eukprot:scaffold1855_cov123-Chaetoceros_neogracile.AAC.2
MAEKIKLSSRAETVVKKVRNKYCESLKGYGFMCSKIKSVDYTAPTAEDVAITKRLLDEEVYYQKVLKRAKFIIGASSESASEKDKDGESTESFPQDNTSEQNNEQLDSDRSNPKISIQKRIDKYVSDLAVEKQMIKRYEALKREIEELKVEKQMINERNEALKREIEESLKRPLEITQAHLEDGSRNSGDSDSSSEYENVTKINMCILHASNNF